MPRHQLNQFWDVEDSSQVALVVQGLASSLDPGSVCVYAVPAPVRSAKQ